MTTWKHDDLAEDLATHLRGGSDRMVWTDMQLGPAGSPRPDVYTVPCSFKRFQPIAYECKISVADFRRDVTAGKWTSYLKFAAGVIFAVPAGLVKKEDVPAGCGLMTRGETGWRTVKGPTLGAVENLPRDAWIKLLLDGVSRLHNDAADRMRPQIRNEWTASYEIREKLGAVVSDAIASRMMATNDFEVATRRVKEATKQANEEYQKVIDSARARAQRDSQQIDGARAELARALGLADDAKTWDIVHAAREAAVRLSADDEIARLRRQFESIERAVRQATEPLPAVCGAEG
ncbi:hypothetical protein AWB80_07516 [Caballeronia pedi]|uniref:MmcB family DNA repair protein n=1 Tax=Caballeronia pedi TaxID=1777141 RepID=A0A158DUX4_9BURK|nr:hypothetical protein [Caballeronia pedi]SAK98421.1 hypothetical protein AWB80_07516 [Caballeronia pedi]